jgi:hypothetical protein
VFNASDVRLELSGLGPTTSAFATEVSMPKVEVAQEPDMEVVEL